MRKKISGMSDSAVKLLKGYSWPGNVRELENVIERAVNLAHGEILTEKELPVELKRNPIQCGKYHEISYLGI